MIPAPLFSLDTLLSLFWVPLSLPWSLVLISLAAETTFKTPITSPVNPFTSLTSLTSLQITLPLALFYTLLYILDFLNTRFAYSRPRKIHLENEVVVVTGGASGLGYLIARNFHLMGASVAVWDLRNKVEENQEEEEGGIKFYSCDVGDVESVRRTWEQVKNDLGTPTILINNAGIVNGLPLLSLPTPDLERNFRVNLFSHFHTVQTFLPAMLQRENGGTIVTISSVLGHLGACNLSDYSASKAGLFAFHNSLRAEVDSMARAKDAPPGAKNIQTVLVKPGQLSTAMFESIETPSSFLGPVVDAHFLALEIFKVVADGRSGVIAAPLYARWIEWMGVLPFSLQRVVRWMSGVDRAMEGFGKSEKAKI